MEACRSKGSQWDVLLLILEEEGAYIPEDVHERAELSVHASGKIDASEIAKDTGGQRLSPGLCAKSTIRTHMSQQLGTP
eukprot:1488233-Amphidinium_carterae.1